MDVHNILYSRDITKKKIRIINKYIFLNNNFYFIYEIFSIY